MTTDPTPDRIETIALDLIDPDPQNRAAPPDEAFQQSVAQHGVLQPILVTPADDPHPSRDVAAQVSATEDQAKRVLELADALEQDDDVQRVFHTLA